MEELYTLLCGNNLVIDWYLQSYVFQETMHFQELKVSACGQELGAADMLFKRRLGFSGTPSDMLPIDLGKCRYDLGIVILLFIILLILLLFHFALLVANQLVRILSRLLRK